MLGIMFVLLFNLQNTYTMSEGQEYPIDPPVLEPRDPYLFSKMTIELTQMNLGVSANFLVYLYDINGTLLTVKNMLMQGQDYQNWTNDSYVPEWVINQLRK